MNQFKHEVRKLFSNRSYLIGVMIIVMLSTAIFSIQSISSPLYESRDADRVSINEKVEDNSYVQTIMSYPDYFHGIINSKKPILISYYESLESIDLVPHYTNGVEMFFSQSILGFTVMIIGIFTTYMIFETEISSGMNNIIYLAKKGDRRSLLNKLLLNPLLVFLISVGLTALFFLITQVLFGPTQLSQPIQSVLYFFESPYAFTISQMLMRYILNLFLVGMICVMLFIIIRSVVKNSYLATIVFASLVILQLLLLWIIKPHSIFQVFRKINLVTWLNPSSITNSYGIYGILGMIVNKQILVILITLFCVILAVVVGSGMSKSVRINIKSPLQLKWLGTHTNLFLHELYKIVIAKKGILVLLLLVVILGDSLKQPEYKIQYDLSYYETYSGPISEAEDNSINNHFAEYEAEQVEFYIIAEQFEAGEIEEEEYFQHQEAYIESISKFNTFQIFYDEYRDSIGNQVIFADGYYALFGMRTSARDIINGALAVIALILLTANLFVTEGDEGIIKLTKNGSIPLLRSRLKVMLLVGLSVYLIVFGFDFIKFYNLYPMNDWCAPISVLERHSLTFELTPILNPSSSILTYFILLQLTRIIGILSVLSIVAYTSKKLNNAIAVLIAGMLIVFVPQIMVTLGFDIFNIINIFDVVTGNLFLLSGKGIFKLILCLFIIAYMQYLLYQTSKQ